MVSVLWQHLSEILIRVDEATTEEDIYRQVGDGLRAHGLRSTIALLEEMLGRFRVVYASASRPILIAAERLFGARGIGYEIPLEDSFTLGQAIQERTAVFRRDALPVARASHLDVRPRTLKRGIDLISASPHIAAPLIARDRVFGAIVVQSAHLRETDREPIAAFAVHVATAIDHLRQNAEAASREHQLSIIVQINQTVSADLTNVSRAYDVVLHEVKRLVSFDQAEVALIEPSTGRVRLSSPGTDTTNESRTETTYALAGSVIEWMSKRGGTYIAKDTQTDREFVEAGLALARGMRSLIALPMRHRGQTLGAFILKSRTPFFYGDADVRLLAPIVDQMANSLANYRLFDQVEQARRHLQAVLDSTSDAVIAVDVAGCISLINPAAERLFVRGSLPVTGRFVWEAIDQPVLADAFRQAVEGKFDAPAGFEIHVTDEVVLFADLAPIRDLHAHSLGWMAIIRDITHFKRLEALRSDAVAMAAHDLRSPLHLASGALGVLAEDAALLSQYHREAVVIAQSGLRRMRMLIDDLLDIKKLEDGLGLDRRDCPLDAVLRSVVSELSALATARRQQLTLDAPEHGPVIQADVDRLHQVFANLIGNAIKYTQEGGAITIRARVHADQVQVAVIDNGPGISLEDQTHIFEKFYRTRSALAVEGTGMGLAIVKLIVEQHGGQVIVQSAPGQGSQFIVSLPLRSA